jgi:hypothetical protein
VVRHIHILNRFYLFTGAGCQGIQPDGAIIELLDDGGEQLVAVGLIHADLVNLQRIQCGLSKFPRKYAIGFHMLVVTQALSRRLTIRAVPRRDRRFHICPLCLWGH